MHRPYKGIRIIDLTHFHAGPLCTYELALLGAEVIKVESPEGGDMLRRVTRDKGLRAVGLGALFTGQNANKKSVVLDLKQDEGRNVFRRLVATADVVVENMRPGAMDRLGLGYADLSEINPRLVYCALSGFGQTGPLSDRPGFDHCMQGFAGIMSVTGSEDSGPLKVGFPIADSGTALMAAFAISSALYEAKSTGKGLLVDVSMLESCLVLQSLLVYRYLNGGEEPRRIGNDALSVAPYVGTFETKDGIILLNPSVFRHFRQLCISIDREDLNTDPRCENESLAVRNRVWLRREIQDALYARDAVEWEDILSRDGVPASRVRTIPEVLAEEQTRSRSTVTHLRDIEGAPEGVRTLNVGFRLGQEGPAPDRAPPRLGEHTLEVLEDIGLDREEITRLLSGRVAVAAAPL